MNYAYSICYNTVFSLWGYAILKDTEIFPWQFGGSNGSCSAMLASESGANLYPEKVPGTTLYSLAMLGYALEQIYKQMFIDTKSNDFCEMFLHHMATSTLFVGMILMNQERSGVVIAFVHLLADIPLGFTKMLSHMEFKYTSIACFVITLGTWMYTRNYLVPWLWWCTVGLVMPIGFEQF